MTEAARSATIVLPSFADEADLFGDADPKATLARLHGLGAAEVIVKDGDAPIQFRLGQETVEALPVRVADAVDTTGAGDSFNGAYLAARLAGDLPADAARRAHRVAAAVIQVRGALAPFEQLRSAFAA